MNPSEELKLSQHLALIQSGFERGQYHQVLDQIQQAQRRYPQSGKLRLWQALVQEALGQTQEAIHLAQTLVGNPDPEVAQQARYVLSIWQAPRLRRPPEWLTEIPDLSQLEEADPANHRLPYRHSLGQSRPATSSPAATPRAADRFDTKLVWVLIGILSALLAILAGLP